MGNSGSRETGPTPAGAPAAGAQVTETAESSCPVPSHLRGKAIYNVYNQRIDGAVPQGGTASVPSPDVLDPRNNMPLEANQQPCPGQRRLLSTERVSSTIPKGGTDGTWVYPSPQMFFNALRRKGKGDDVAEDDMDSVIHAHNTMNEITWQQVMVWESLHRDTCCESKLLRFRGRPDDLRYVRHAAFLGFGVGRWPFRRGRARFVE